MTEWTHHIPDFDGDAPEGVTLDTHFINLCFSSGQYCDGHWNYSPLWHEGFTYRYRPRNPPATYEQVKAYCEQHGLPVPPKPVNYEAWGPVLAKLNWDKADKADVRGLIAAMRVAMADPELRKVVEG